MSFQNSILGRGQTLRPHPSSSFQNCFWKCENNYSRVGSSEAGQKPAKKNGTQRGTIVIHWANLVSLWNLIREHFKNRMFKRENEGMSSFWLFFTSCHPRSWFSLHSSLLWFICGCTTRVSYSSFCLGSRLANGTLAGGWRGEGENDGIHFSHNPHLSFPHSFWQYRLFFIVTAVLRQPLYSSNYSPGIATVSSHTLANSLFIKKLL